MMALLDNHLLSLIIFFPLLGALALALVPGSAVTAIRSIGGIASAVPLLLGVVLFALYRGVGGFEFSDHLPWITSLGISYWVGVDGISFYMIEMTLLLIPLSLVMVLAGTTTQLRARVILILLLETTLLAAFAALDLFLFYLCFELAGLILYFLLGLDAKSSQLYWTRAFLMFQLIGSALLLLCWCVLASSAGGSFNLADLMRHPMDLHRQIVWVTVLLGGVAIKSALIPVHSWFRGIQEHMAPALIIIIAAVYLKIGVYGLLRFVYPLLPQGLADVHLIVMNVAVVTVVVAGLLTVTARSLAAALAYVTIAQMGLMVLGVASLNMDGAQGSLFHMFQHGIIIALLALCMALPFRPNASGYRWVLLLTLLGGLAAMGLPGTSGFVGLLMVLLGSYQAAGASSIITLLAWTLMAGALFMALLRHLKGASEPTDVRVLPRWGIVLTLPLLFLILMGGWAPQYFLKKSESAVTGWLAYVQPKHLPDTITIIRGGTEEQLERPVPKVPPGPPP